jgi:hypothetical protein
MASGFAPEVVERRWMRPTEGHFLTTARVAFHVRGLDVAKRTPRIEAGGDRPGAPIVA